MQIQMYTHTHFLHILRHVQVTSSCSPDNVPDIMSGMSAACIIHYLLYVPCLSALQKTRSWFQTLASLAQGPRSFVHHIDFILVHTLSLPAKPTCAAVLVQLRCTPIDRQGPEKTFEDRQRQQCCSLSELRLGTGWSQAEFWKQRAMLPLPVLDFFPGSRPRENDVDRVDQARRFHG